MRRPFLVSLFAVFCGLASCFGDHFLDIRGQVVECVSMTPVADVAITLDDLSGATPRREPTLFHSDAKGAFEVHEGLRPDTTVLLSFSKDGFQPTERTVQGSLASPLSVCLRPATAPAAN